MRCKTRPAAGSGVLVIWAFVPLCASSFFVFQPPLSIHPTTRTVPLIDTPTLSSNTPLQNHACTPQSLSRITLASKPELKEEEDRQLQDQDTRDKQQQQAQATVESLLKQKEERETMINRLKLQLNEFKSRVEDSEEKARAAGQQIVDFLQEKGLLNDIQSQFR